MSGVSFGRLMVLTLASVLVLGMASPGPSEEGPPAATGSSAITDSSAMAAVVGLITRIPAEIQGGALYAATSVNLDKARARGSAVYPGYLADTFLKTSVEGYGELYAEVDAVAENPPNSEPASDRVEGGQEGPTGPLGTIRADTPDPKQATALATGASSAEDAGELLAFEASTARSHSRVADDGTVVTEALATLSGVRLAEVVTIGNIESRAVVTTSVGQKPEIVFATNLERLAVAGVAAVLDQHGLRIADSAVVSEDEIARFNETVTALADAGITLEAVPTSVVEEAGHGAVAGAALRFRYEAKKNETVAGVLGSNPIYQVVPLPKELGYDEEFLLGQVQASSLSRAAGDLGFGLDLGLSEGGLPEGPATGAESPPAGSASLSSPPTPSGTKPVGSTTESPPTPSGTSPVGTTPEAPEVAEVAEPAASADADAGGAAPEPFALTASAASGLDHLASFYRLLLLLALAGAVAPRLLRRATTAK